MSESNPTADPDESDGSAPTGAQLRLAVPDMDCSSCAGKVEGALDREGVRSVDTRPTTGVVVLTYDPEATDVEALTAAVEGAGYAVADAESDGVADGLFTSPRAIATAVGGAFLAVGLALEWLLPGLDPTFATIGGVGFLGPWAVTGASVAYLLAVGVAGPPILRNGFYSLRGVSLDIDLLMSVGVVAALLVDLPFEAATLAVLFSVAELLERYSIDRARTSLRELMELSPDEAVVIRDGEEETVPAEAVATGERLAVRPGERVPLDGVVREGSGAVDESPITGESVPAEKEPGDEVYAGSINEAGYLEVEATAPAEESTIARVVDLVEAANGEETRAERFVDRFAGVYTPIVVVGAVATAALGPVLVGGGAETWFVRGLTLLVVACPCAFVISTPVSVVSGVTAAARNGVLIKGGEHLEAAGDVGAVALDKTGTLTRGELSVTDVVPLGDRGADDVLACATAIERRSEHPVAAAIVARGEEAGAEPDGEDATAVTGFEALTGEGVRADLDGETHYAGKPSLFEELGFDLSHAHVRPDGGVVRERDADADAPDAPDDAGASVTEPESCDHGQYLDLASETIPRLQAEGKTVVLVGTETELEGVIAVADTVRPEAAWVVDRLHELGVDRVAMLTGDNDRTARAIGERVGVDEVRAELLPDEKVDAVRELAAETDSGVAMVGDGINDAPALAAADVGVAMGAAGTDTAIETADVALMADDLTRLPYVVDLASRASSTIRTNIGASLAVKALLAAGAPLGYVSVAMAVVVGDMGMSLGVTGNALRLGNVEPAEPSGAATDAAEPNADAAASEQ
ncbi:cation-translocating P-type ATPase [Halorubrum ezzemoulense]|uniref:heavy metal translocating P-type ATPase n=1 Tax=Halorubrum ezzemoulense TaxID=337243 RepID=UPI0023304FCD|nr:cation-translocating P-type ATPase [Halorubrum ezzemoulense]MDB2261855.1 cation-translocating P-type ATPase [Halorubrum ezzemoulense]MDB2268738.1 cation-translocating P-type ATPase [Halorubrum ezzemoulense]